MVSTIPCPPCFLGSPAPFLRDMILIESWDPVACALVALADNSLQSFMRNAKSWSMFVNRIPKFTSREILCGLSKPYFNSVGPIALQDLWNNSMRILLHIFLCALHFIMLLISYFTIFSAVLGPTTLLKFCIGICNKSLQVLALNTSCNFDSVLQPMPANAHKNNQQLLDLCRGVQHTHIIDKKMWGYTYQEVLWLLNLVWNLVHLPLLDDVLRLV